MGAQKGKLFKLARMYRSYQKTCKEKPEAKKKTSEQKPVKATGQHYDEGKAISLTYNLDMYPEVLHDSYQRQATSLSLWDNDHSEAFYVEPFDEETIEVPYHETNANDTRSESEDDQLDKIARGFSSRSQEEDEDEHEDLSGEEDKLGDMSKKIDDMFKSDDEEESGSMSAESNEAVPVKGTGDDDAISVEQLPESEVANQQSFAYEASDEEFARDIGAILTGQKLYDSETKKTVGKNSATPPATNSNKSAAPAKSSSGSGDDMLDPNKNEHKIFEKIAQSMTYANSYDLGAIALEEKFELMDREIEKQDIKSVLQTKTPEKSADNIQYADVVDEEKKQEVSTGLSDEQYNPKIPLDNSNGGRLVKADQLLKGDLILAGNSGDCIGGVYVGGNKVLTKGEGGTFTEQGLDTLLTNNNVITILRHQYLDSDKGAQVVEALYKLQSGVLKDQPAPWLKVSIPAMKPHADVCSGTNKEKCLAFTGKINLGTQSNDTFQCTESMITVFEKYQMAFVPMMSKEHNGSLRYFGHLKNKS